MKAQFYLKHFTAIVCITMLTIGVFQTKTAIGQTSGMAISPTGSNADPSAGLDVNFSDKGLLIPRVSLIISTLSSPVLSPAASLLVYNTAYSNDVTPGYYYWDGFQWMRLQSGTSSGSGITCSTSNQYYTVRGDGSGGWECTDALRVSGYSSSGGVGINTSPSSFFDLRVNSNVGIGFSPSSSYALSVDGNAYVTDYMGVGTSPSSTWDLRVGTSGLGVGSSPSSSFLLSVDGDGHIGNGLSVGTTSSAASSGIIASGEIRTNTRFNLQSSSTGTGTAVVRTSSGYLMPQSSTIKVKDNVKDLKIDKENFLKIRPVSFNLKKAYGGDLDIGVIAEEVEKLVPDLVVYGPKRTWIGNDGETLKNADGSEMVSKTEVEPYSVRYDKLGVYLIKIVADQDKEIELLKKKIELQEKILAKLAESNPALKELQGTSEEASISNQVK